MAKGDYNRLTQEQFEEKVHKQNPNLDIIGKYKSAHEKIKYKCKICGYIGETEGNSLMRGHTGCRKCNNKLIIEGYNDFATKYPNLMIYLVNKEDGIGHNSSKGEVLCECPICHDRRYVSFHTLSDPEKGFSCPRCSDGESYPNRFMYCLLRQLNIKFDREKTFKWSEGRIYDFVIDNIIIEMDGGFHKGSNYRSYEECKAIDDLKDRLAKENGYNLIRIPCYKSDFVKIKNEVILRLFDIINIKDVNWVALEWELINNNLVVLASETFNKYKGVLSIKEMADKLNMQTSKLCPLLKTGARIGLTDYDPKKSISGKYTPLRLKQKHLKKVLCIETNEIFNSAVEASKRFGIKYSDSISRVCRGERAQTHNLHFKYVE